MNLLSIALVFGGAGMGGVTRYLLNLGLNPLLADIPLGTLAANVLGCGAAGAIAAFLDDRLALDPTLRPLLIVGFLGGLTTFSSFALEVVQSLESQRTLLAIGIVLLHVGASLAAAIAGLIGVRALLA
ncbi:MAG: CrcB family protein [Steroidobacteraceae bacterium]